MKFHIIYNPVVGKGKNTNIVNQIENYAKQKNIEIVTHQTRGVGNATEIIRRLTDSNQIVNIIVMGGDGTLNEVINGIVNFNNTYIGIIPVGSGNDFARCLEIKENDEIATFDSIVTNGFVKKHDFLVINDRIRVLNMLSLGISAEVIRCFNKSRSFGPKLRYRIATIRKSVFFRKFKYRVSINGRPFEDISSILFAIGNGKYFGSGVTACPEAKPYDGKISVTHIKPFNHLMVLFNLSKMIKGKTKKIKQARFIECEQIILKLNSNAVEYDGILLVKQNELKITIEKQKLNIFVPFIK